MDIKVSVYITTYNRCDRLFRAVESVLQQSYEQFEILVCDDASTDDTQEKMLEIVNKDNRIRYFRNNSNKGACYSRNIALQNAQGKFITGLDDDDEFTPDRLQLFLDNWDDKYSFICSNFLEVYPDRKNAHYVTNQNEKYTYKDLLYKNIASNQIFTLTEKLKSINGFDENVKRLQDWDTWLRLSYAHGPFLRLSHPSYLMHHDHAKSEYRVSKSYGFGNALKDLGVRNKYIYKTEEYLCLKYLLSYYDRKLSFVDSIKWAFYQKDINNLLRYFNQKISRKTSPE